MDNGRRRTRSRGILVAWPRHARITAVGSAFALRVRDLSRKFEIANGSSTVASAAAVWFANVVAVGGGVLRAIGLNAVARSGRSGRDRVPGTVSFLSRRR